MKKPFHVYAIDGFESAHSSKDAAVKAAKRGAKARRVEYRVVECDSSGMTGGGHGDTVFVASPR